MLNHFHRGTRILGSLKFGPVSSYGITSYLKTHSLKLSYALSWCVPPHSARASAQAASPRSSAASKVGSLDFTWGQNSKLSSKNFLTDYFFKGCPRNAHPCSSIIGRTPVHSWRSEALLTLQQITHSKVPQENDGYLIKTELQKLFCT